MREKSMKWRFNFNKQSPGYTPLHTSRSDKELHCSFKGNTFMVHVYGKGFPWPIGKSPDKWLSRRERGKQ